MQMPAEPKNCFLDSQRICDASCRAFEPKKEECAILKSLGAISSSLQTLQRASSTTPPPRY